MNSVSGNMMLKKFLKTILCAFLIISCNKLESDRSVTLEERFSSVPTTYLEKLKVNSQYVTDRCRGLEGPTKSSSFFNVKNKNKNLVKFEQWKNRNNFLYERSILDIADEKYFYSVEQYGCSRYGFSILIILPKNLAFESPQAVIGWVKNFHKSEVFSQSAKQEIQNALKLIEDDHSFYETNCSVRKQNISCTSYVDPKNLELFLKGPEIKLNYWFVL